MKISAIQCYQPMHILKSAKKNRAVSATMLKEDGVPKNDVVAFKANETAKGIGLGALVGLGALTLLSGGAAAPLAYGIYAAASGAAGGMLGKAIEETNKKNDNKDDKE